MKKESEHFALIQSVILVSPILKSDCPFLSSQLYKLRTVCLLECMFSECDPCNVRTATGS